jgi:hypothetical protein
MTRISIYWVMLKTRYILLLLFLVPLLVAGFFLEKRYGKPSQSQQTQQLRQLTQKGEFQDGDLIFHTSRSAQSKDIQLATKSAYSHCGIIYKTAGGYQVFEAVQLVSSTPLDKWVARGEGGHFVVKRLKNAKQILTPSARARLKKEGEKFAGKGYDLYFEWSDDKIYCSELIYKIYQRATGVEIGRLEKLSDFDLSAPPVQAKMKERYGNRIPYEEDVISPASLFDSDVLVTVAQR